MKGNAGLLICLRGLLSLTARPDHLDDNLISRIRSEHVLAGINVWRDVYKNVQNLNAATRVIRRRPNDPCSDNNCGGKEEVSWEAKGCVIRAWGMYPGPNKTRGVAGVEVVPGPVGSGWGCATGRGLALSEPFREAVALYGNRYFVSRKDNNGMTVLYEWKDGAQMDMETDRDQEIIRIGLSPSEAGLSMRPAQTQ
jgi:hypothetical protein